MSEKRETRRPRHYLSAPKQTVCSLQSPASLDLALCPTIHLLCTLQYSTVEYTTLLYPTIPYPTLLLPPLSCSTLVCLTLVCAAPRVVSTPATNPRHFPMQEVPAISLSGIQGPGEQDQERWEENRQGWGSGYRDMAKRKESAKRVR